MLLGFMNYSFIFSNILSKWINQCTWLISKFLCRYLEITRDFTIFRIIFFFFFTDFY